MSRTKLYSHNSQSLAYTSHEPALFVLAKQSATTPAFRRQTCLAMNHGCITQLANPRIRTRTIACHVKREKERGVTRIPHASSWRGRGGCILSPRHIDGGRSRTSTCLRHVVGQDSCRNCPFPKTLLRRLRPGGLWCSARCSAFPTAEPLRFSTPASTFVS